MNTTERFLTVENLKVRLGGRTLASLPQLELGPGECVSLVGESGSGKTTSLMTLLGLNRKQGLVFDGEVRLFGEDVLAASERSLRKLRGRKISLIMQSPQAALNPTLKLAVTLKRALGIHGVKKAEAKARMREAFGSVRLDEDIAERYPHEISGGQAQRFSIAIALALGSDVIAADEPTSALDTTVQAEIADLLTELCSDRGLGLLLVSHDLALVSNLADRIIVMKNGHVVEAGSAHSVLQAPADPYTLELIRAGIAVGGA